MPEDASTQGFQIFDLGTLPGGGISTALDINNSGQVVGETHLFPEVRVALWAVPLLAQIDLTPSRSSSTGRGG